MDNPFFVDIADPKAVIADGNGDLWIPFSESDDLSRLTEIVNVAGVYFDVVGYSEDRDALLIEPIVIEGSAEHLEEEMIEYLSEADGEA